MARPTVIFTHIQKTAGTTVGRFLKLMYACRPPSNVLRLDLTMGLHHLHNDVYADFPHVRSQALQELGPSQRARIRYIQGHMSFGLHELFDQPTTYITAVREPVSRVLSHFAQIQNLLPAAQMPQARELTLKARKLGLREFVTRYPIDALCNFQTKMLAGVNDGLPGSLSPYDIHSGSDELLQRALKNFDDRFHCIVTERLDESLLVLQRQLNWPLVFYFTSNVSKRRMRESQLKGAEIDLITELNSLDLRLYEHALDKLDEDCRLYGSELTKSLENLQTRNHHINRWLAAPVDRVLKSGRSLLNRRYRTR